jgi:hypothetical protein
MTIRERNNAIKEFLRNNPERLLKDYDRTAAMFNCTAEIVRHQSRALRVEMNIASKAAAPPVSIEQLKDPKFVITDQIMARRENAMIKSLKKQIEEAIKDYEELSDSYDIALALKTQDISSFKIKEIKANPAIKSEATAIVQLSDTHFGKIVLPSTVNGLNEHNPDIARKRMDTLADNMLKLIEKERSDIKIENLVLGLGGDFMENSMLHEHSQMTTAFSPMEEMLFSRELLYKFIKTIAERGKFKKIMLPCVRGNHSRTTKKMNSSVDYRTNFEAMLYNILKQDFSDKMFEWIVPDSDICEFQVYNKRIRSMHGWQVKSGGGIGGLTIPLNKYILRMDQISKCDYNLMHHYHSLSYPTSNCTLNGSLVGYDPYAMQIGASFQKPMQAFQLLDKNRGFTIKAPIFCD